MKRNLIKLNVGFFVTASFLSCGANDSNRGTADRQPLYFNYDGSITNQPKEMPVYSTDNIYVPIEARGKTAAELDEIYRDRPEQDPRHKHTSSASKSYQDIYDNAYEEGYEEGYKKGHDEGKNREEN